LQLFNYPKWVYLILYLVGGSVIVLRIIRHGKQRKITHYHHEPWGQRSIIVTGLMMTGLICFTFFALNGTLTTLDYYPYPYLTLPGIQFSGFVFYALSIIPIFFINND